MVFSDAPLVLLATYPFARLWRLFDVVFAQQRLHSIQVVLLKGLKVALQGIAVLLFGHVRDEGPRVKVRGSF